MFAFNTSFAKLFYTFKIVFFCFSNSNKFVVNICVGVYIVRLGIGGVRFIVGTYYLSKVDSVYQLGSLDYSCIAGITETTMPKPNLQIGTKAISRSASSLHKHYLPFEANFKHKKVFVPACHLQYALSLLEYYGIGVVMLCNA